MARDLGAFPIQTRAPRDLGAMPSTTSTPQRTDSVKVGGVPLSLGQKLQQFRSEAIAPYVARQKETAEASRLGEQTGVQTAFQTGANVIGAGLAPVVAGAGEALKTTAPVLSKVPGAGIVGGIATGLGKAYDWTVDKASDVLSTPLGMKVIGEKKQPWERDLEALNEYLQVIPVGKTGKVANVALEEASKIKKVADIAKAKTQIEDIANKITLGQRDDAKISLEGLSGIDVNTKTYKELGDRLDDKVGTLASALDEKLATDTRIIPLEEATLTEKVASRAGDVEVKHNFVKDALKQLDELYEKANDPVSRTKIQILTDKATNEGLTIKEMNQLARKYGQEFGSKAFGKVNGEPLTSVSAQSFENTRSGIKDTARQFFGDEAYKEIDEKIWQTMATKKMVDKVDEKVLDINQKIKERGLGETVGRAVFNTLDALSMKSLGGFVKAGFPRGQGEKIMNYREIEEALSGNLKRMQELQKIIDGTPDENILIKKLNEFNAKAQATPNKQGGFANLSADVFAKGDDALIQEAKKYKTPEEFVKAQGKEIYHATDSQPFDVYDATKGAKGERFFNPLGQGMYLSSNKDFIGRFGKNKLEYVIPKGANVKTVTIDSWAKNDYPVIVRGTLKKLGISYDDLTLGEKVELNRQVPNTAIESLNNAEVLIRDISKRLGKKGSVQEAIESVSDARNSKYDAIVFKDTDYALGADEILVPDSSILKTPSQLTDIWKKAHGGADDLVTQAKKYATPDEFVKAQGTPVYHGTAKEFDSFDMSKSGSVQYSDWGNGLYLTPSKSMAKSYGNQAVRHFDSKVNSLYTEMEDKAKSFGTTGMMKSIDKGSGKISQAQYDELKRMEDAWRMRLYELDKESAGKVMEFYLAPDAKVMEYTYQGITDPLLSREALAKGYDAILIDKGMATEELLVMNTDKLKTRSQLTDIWKKAQETP